MIAQENDTCYICSQPIIAGISEVSWARRGDNNGARYHIQCKANRTTQPKPFNPAIAPSGDAGAMLAAIIQPHLALQREEISEEIEERIQDAVAFAIENYKPKTVYIQQGKTIGTINDDCKHEHFDLLVQLIAMRESVYLWGEAGSGKSTAAHKAATLLNLPFYYLGLQAQTTESRLMGYNDANGRYIESDFYKAYAHGGVFLLDELELGNGNLLGSLNGALANGRASFPCGIVERHPDFICIATGNTPALGASLAYSDRRPLDAAVRDRFVFVEWNTDKTLELKLAATYFAQSEKWVRWIQSVRESAKKVSPKLIVTQRASLVGSRLLNAGMEAEQVAEMLVWRGIDRASVTSLLNSHPLPKF